MKIFLLCFLVLNLIVVSTITKKLAKCPQCQGFPCTELVDNKVTCHCDSCYRGNNCQLLTCMEVCGAFPCRRRRIPMSIAKFPTRCFECECPPCKYGPKCENEITAPSDFPCTDGTTYMIAKDGTCEPTCFECDSDDDCNGGTCTEKKCATCKPCYEGYDCSRLISCDDYCPYTFERVFADGTDAATCCKCICPGDKTGVKCAD
ncbi:hypothetical protein SNEBB_002973 [Seison nebaliae]|nr:hypothetical protein SNEBB_002973 [Seison nebaliae]